MKNKFIYHNFIKWLNLNHHRFLIPSYIENINETSFIMVFQNVDYIKVIFKDSGEVEIWAVKEEENGVETLPLLKEFADILYEFDLRERKLNKGYLCEVCELGTHESHELTCTIRFVPTYFSCRDVPRKMGGF